MIGKRKRDTSVVSRATMGDDEEPARPTTDLSAQDLMRKYFEAQFEPLEVPGGPVSTEKENEDESEYVEEDESEDSGPDSEWGGFSDSEDEDNQVEVIEHKDSSVKSDKAADKRARKAFMSAKVPSFTTDESKPTPKESKEDNKGGDDATDAEHLKNDLALQRLLKESHLLESASELAPTGKNRHKALDLRMQALGAKASIYQQQHMPTSHRRGIKAKGVQKEEKRRREAKENGIILEKPAPKSKSNSGRRERGVGGPSVGKFAGGTLNLSKRDLAAVQGPRRPTKGKPKGRR